MFAVIPSRTDPTKPAAPQAVANLLLLTPLIAPGVRALTTPGGPGLAIFCTLIFVVLAGALFFGGYDNAKIVPATLAAPALIGMARLERERFDDL